MGRCKRASACETSAVCLSGALSRSAALPASSSDESCIRKARHSACPSTIKPFRDAARKYLAVLRQQTVVGQNSQIHDCIADGDADSSCLF